MMSKADSGMRFVYIAASVSALGGLLFGYNVGVISGAILFIKGDFGLSAVHEGIVVSAAPLGALMGATVGGPLSDRFGRRKTLLLTAAVFVLGSLVTASATTVAWLVAGQVIVGAGIGLASFASPLYISEVSPSAVRGKMVALNQIALTAGIVLSYLVDYALSGMRGWRLMFAVSMIPASLLGIGMAFMPESPRWLVRRALTDKARDVLKRIRERSDVEDELQDIQGSLRGQQGSWSELASPLVRPALITGIGLAVFQQMTGINTVIYYAPTIFQFAGFQSASTAILATFGVGVINVLMTILARQLLDRVGRRPLLLISLAGMTLGLGVLGLAFFLPALSGVLAWIAVGSLMLYVGSFAIGMGPVFWLLISEIYPLSIRGMAMGIATLANWGANLLVALTFLILIQFLGRPLTFWFYGLVGVGAWLFAYSFVPETKGRTLEEIEKHWRAGRHPREMGQY